METTIQDFKIKTLINAYNKNIITSKYEKGKGYTYFKKPKNRKIQLIESRFQKSDLVLTIKLKELTAFLHKQKINLKSMKTKDLLHFYKSYRFNYLIMSWNAIFPLYEESNSVSCLMEVKKELDNRKEHIVKGNQLKQLRQYCAKHKVSKEVAKQRLFGGK